MRSISRLVRFSCETWERLSVVNSGLGPWQAGNLKSLGPTCLALGSENGSEKGAQAAGTESLTGGV